MGHTANNAVQGNVGGHLGALTGKLAIFAQAPDAEQLGVVDVATAVMDIGAVMDVAAVIDVATVDFAGDHALAISVSIADANGVGDGVRTLAITAGHSKAGTKIRIHADRETVRKALLEEVDRAYMAADAGCPGTAQRYLEATIAAAQYLSREFPDDPRTRSLNHLVVDIAAWMHWDPKTAGPSVRAGVLEAALYTEEHPEPNWYVTVDDPTLTIRCQAPPAPWHIAYPKWLPGWARWLLSGLVMSAFVTTRVEGHRVLHPVDHRQRARDLIGAIAAASSAPCTCAA